MLNYLSFQLRMIYHRIMAVYCGWRLRSEIRKFREAGRKAGLPLLDAYSDQQLVEGLRQFVQKRTG